MFRKGIAAALLATCVFQTTGANAAAILNPDNGHYYEYVLDLVSWRTALTQAEAAGPRFGVPAGFSSYLVTITSAQENSFISRNISASRDFWIGGTDEAVEGRFVWAAGPETGMPLTYTSFSPGEPNDVGTFGEDYVQSGISGQWNDLSTSANLSYVIEYSASAAAIPEPATWAMMIMGFGMMGGAMRYRSRSTKLAFAE